MLDAQQILINSRCTVSFHPCDLARELLAYGEIDAAEKIMQLDTQAIAAIGVLASNHYSAPESATLDKAICLAVVEFLEDTARPLKRKRRIYQKETQE